MTVILGISAYYHDSAVSILRDGEVIYAAQEERFSRIKHDRSFPIRAIHRGLQETGLRLSDIEHVAYYDKPLLTFERLFETWLAYAPRGFRSFSMALPAWLNEKLFLTREMDAALGTSFTGSYHFSRHHQSHAASAFFPSPFEEAAILTMDGVGEWSTTTLGIGKGHDLQLLSEIRFPHSLGLLYSAFTYYLGFKVNSGEYKVMGLAPYGRPVYAELIHKHLIDLKPDGSFWMDMRYFNYCQGLTMTSSAFHDLFGGNPRTPESPLTPREMDLAASVQKVCEDVMLALAKHARRATGADYLCMAGGCALNCVANGLISRERIFKQLFIQPAAGDAGGSLGSALQIWHHALGHQRNPQKSDALKGSLVGPRATQTEIETFVRQYKAVARAVEPKTLAHEVARQINEGKVIGLFQGPMEFGPRALGGRSIIGDARRKDMQTTMNLKIKFRESFRPFAPAILEERAAEFVDLNQASPYMLLVAPVSESQRLAGAVVASEGKNGIDLLNIPRSTVPAVTHVDYSARVQTLTRERNGFFYDVVKAFELLTGCPMVINTSFNIRGEPIVNTPEEAYRCFMLTDMDALVIEDQLFLKPDQPPMAGADDYRQSFKLD